MLDIADLFEDNGFLDNLYPTLENPAKQADAVAKYEKQGERITSVEAWRDEEARRLDGEKRLIKKGTRVKRTKNSN